MKHLTLLLGAFLVGCGSAGTVATDSTIDSCQQGTSRPCACDDGSQRGTETCSNGAWSACACAPKEDTPPVDTGSDAPAVCGDLLCEADEGEACDVCPTDCGKCPTCNLAPACTGAFALPTQSTELTDFDNDGKPSYASGVELGMDPPSTSCTAPKLKIRITSIQVNSKGTGLSGLDLFCMVDASDGATSELRFTPAQTGLGDDTGPILLSPGEGTFWGQSMGEVKQSQYNITITYRCFQIDNYGVFTSAIDAAGKAAGGIGQVPGNQYGWAFLLGDVGASAAAAAIQASGGTHLRLQVQQTIDAGALLELTNGRTWTIRQAGDAGGLFGMGKWDWQLGVQAWGCSTPRPRPAQ